MLYICIEQTSLLHLTSSFINVKLFYIFNYIKKKNIYENIIHYYRSIPMVLDALKNLILCLFEQNYSFFQLVTFLFKFQTFYKFQMQKITE